MEHSYCALLQVDSTSKHSSGAPSSDLPETAEVEITAELSGSHHVPYAVCEMEIGLLSESSSTSVSDTSELLATAMESARKVEELQLVVREA